MFAAGKAFKGQFKLRGSGSETSPNLATAYHEKTGKIFTEWTDKKPIIQELVQSLTGKKPVNASVGGRPVAGSIDSNIQNASLLLTSITGAKFIWIPILHLVYLYLT